MSFCYGISDNYRMTMLGGAIVGVAIGGVLGFSAGLGIALVVVAGMVPEMARPKVRVPDSGPRRWK